MELRHLRYLVTLADELHFGRAAARLYISQPSLSAQIQQLESEVGVTLLRRTRRKVELTEPGRLLVEDARKLIQGAEQAVETARLAEMGQLGHVNVGYIDPAALTILPIAIRDFRLNHPRVGLALDLV